MSGRYFENINSLICSNKKSIKIPWEKSVRKVTCHHMMIRKYCPFRMNIIFGAVQVSNNPFLDPTVIESVIYANPHSLFDHATLRMNPIILHI